MFLICGCVGDLVPQQPVQGSEDALEIMGQVGNFSVNNADTKSGETNPEKKVTNMMMLVTDNGGTIIDAQFVYGSQPLFNIIRGAGNYKDKVVDQATIYIIANYNKAFDKDEFIGKNKSIINAITFDVSSETRIDIPEAGFPMYGSKEVNLDPGNTALSNNVIKIELKRLYAKVVFNIRVKPDQWFDDKIQQFQLESWTVFNVPRLVTIGNNPTDNGNHAVNSYTYSYKVDNGNFDDSNRDGVIRTTSSKGDNIVVQSMPDDNSEVLSFSFYMPEHLTEFHQTIHYPWANGREYNDADYANGGAYEQYKEYRQYLKPELVKEFENDVHQSHYATYVEIKGKYTDFNGTPLEVVYEIYPGANEFRDFNIRGDFQYNNNIIIKGIKNNIHADGSWVTYDHRVDVEQKQAVVSMQRETLLDCHWEIRPLRITMSGDLDAEAEMTVQIVDPNGNVVLTDSNKSRLSWLRMDNPSESYISSHSADYCVVDLEDAHSKLAYGKRRYFTENLVSTTLQNNISYTLTKTTPKGTPQEFTIWVYADEYVNFTDADATYDKNHPGYRTALVRCSYTSKEGTPITQDYIFRQWNVFKVVYDSRPYYIEHYEEYLYNFDSKEQYGYTTDGMEWGLDGVQLSDTDNAIAVDGALSDAAATSKVRSVFPNAFYDFYINKTEASAGGGGITLEYHTYAGRSFTDKIAHVKDEHNNDVFHPKATNELPESAVQYCFNKNKRESDGVISDSFKWYLPAIDEIEDICMGGYNDFEVFQDKYYWSSQPSYHIYALSYRFILADRYGSFFMDNVNNARATKVNELFQTVDSGETNPPYRYAFTYFSNNYTTIDLKQTPVLGPGNQSRGTINRVRCVYSKD